MTTAPLQMMHLNITFGIKHLLLLENNQRRGGEMRPDRKRGYINRPGLVLYSSYTAAISQTSLQYFWIY